jgi:hypothetical protein
MENNKDRHCGKEDWRLRQRFLPTSDHCRDHEGKEPNHGLLDPGDLTVRRTQLDQ